MKLTVDLSALWNNVTQMGAEPANIQIDGEWQDADIDFDLDLSRGKIEITLDQVESSQGLLSIKGRQILLFISDHGNGVEEALTNPEKGRKFHVYDCRTLRDMRGRGRFDRYHATNDVSGDFPIFGTNFMGDFAEGKAKLKVCKNCIKELNYKNYANSSGIERNNVVNKFDFAEFFSTYSSLFRYHPKPKPQTREQGYTDNWSDVSTREKVKCSYTCQWCQLHLEQHKKLLHTHHKNGVKNDNSEGNLICLCADCHRKQPFHGHMYIKHSDMELINKLRREQGISLESTWENAKRYADPALFGVLCLAERKNLPPPAIGYLINCKSSESPTAIDCAWPSLKVGISLGSDSVVDNDWRIFSLDSALAYFS